MSFTHAADGTRLHYTVTGRRDGEPVLMIQGLGADSRGWLRQRLAFGSRHQVIVFDNRGVGRSDKPEATYALEDGRAGGARRRRGRARMGASMVAYCADHAVRNPERVRCSSCTAL
jgi:pimeloyl-ACP methyl ester carboxylesterase